jgi:hypothetical protein
MSNMTRRSWFGSILGNDQPERYFFGLQLIINAFGEDTLRARVAALIAEPDGTTENVEAKRRYIKRIVALLQEQQPYWSQVFWDYKTDREEAEAEFESWAAEISASTSTTAEEYADAVDATYRLSNKKDYVAVTVILLLSERFPPAEVDDEALYWKTFTIQSLVQGLTLINPETIVADGVFVVPGSPDDGLSEEDLLTGGWSYLRVLV